MSYQLVVYPFEPINLKTGSLNILECQNTALYDQLTFQFYQSSINVAENEENGVAHIVKDDAFVSFDKSVFLINSIVDYDFNNRRIQTKLLNRITAQAPDTDFRTVDEINSQLNALVGRMLRVYDLPLAFQEDLSLQDFLKVKKVNVDASSSRSYLEYLLSFIELVSEFFEDYLIILTDFMCHVSENALAELSEFVNIKNVNVLFFEHHTTLGIKGVSNLTYHKIDEDLVFF